MTAHVKLWRDKVAVADYDIQIKDLRAQLAEQLRVFDWRLEQKSQHLQDLSDYLRRRSEIEAEYARLLDKLAERFSSRIKRKDPGGQSMARSWMMLLAQTRQEGREHSQLSDTCSSALPQCLTHCQEHTQRLTKRSRDIYTQLQDSLVKLTTELQTAMKSYHQYHGDSLSAEAKLREAERQEEKQKHSGPKRLEKLEKRQHKVQETQLKSTKARNDYLMNLAAANASMSRYYLQDVSTLIDCSDLGYHQAVARVMRGYVAGWSQAQQNLGVGMQQLGQVVEESDQNQDRDMLMQANSTTFCLPLRFQYLPHEGDQVHEVSAEFEMRCELETRFQQLQARLAAVTQNTDEISRMLQSTCSSLLDAIDEGVFGPAPESSSSQSQYGPNDITATKNNQAKRKANLQEMENLYFTKLKDHLSNGTMVAKLQAKHELLQMALQKAEAVDCDSSRMLSRRSIRQRSIHQRKSQAAARVSQKLFTGDLLSYIQSSGQPIPMVVESCIRYINLNGLHHEGIFRVSGSQMVVNQLRDAFEKGEDPLDGRVCDMDSVASVLKLYFRGLEKPLFPEESFSQLMECNQLDDEAERAAQIKTLVSSYPPPLLIVMRYLFAFLHHVSQYSDENMMQPYNLAVCFGPSLMRGPDAEHAVTLQQVIALVKSIITQQESIFPGHAHLPGPLYEKCMTLEPDDCEPIAEEAEWDSPTKEELKGVAMFDYTGRTSVELSFKQGECLLLHSKPSSDWWRGEVNGVKGLIPSKYISTLGEGSLECSRRDDQSRSGGGGQAQDHSTDPVSRPKDMLDRPIVRDSQGSIGRVLLQLPVGPVARPALSPGVLRRQTEFNQRRANMEGGEESDVHVDKEVCLQMNTVFKELLLRQRPPDTPTAAFNSAEPPSPSNQKRGGLSQMERGL